MSASTAASDRLVNKVAMCGALFAGVAYVGYRIVKKAFPTNRKHTKGKNENLFHSYGNRATVTFRIKWYVKTRQLIDAKKRF